MTGMGMRELGKVIEGARLRLGLQAYEVSNAVRMSPSWYSRLEAGKVANTPPPETLHALARVLRVPSAELLAALGYRLEDAPVTTMDLMDPERAELIRKLERVRLDEEGWPHSMRRISTLTLVLDGWLSQDREAEHPIEDFLVDPGNGGAAPLDRKLTVDEP